MKNLFIIGFIISICACNSQQIPKPQPQIPTDSDSCEPGCQHLSQLPGQDGNLGCFETRPLQMPDGTTKSCKDYCLERQAAGRSLHPSCWISLTSCSDIEKVCRQK